MRKSVTHLLQNLRVSLYVNFPVNPSRYPAHGVSPLSLRDGPHLASASGDPVSLLAGYAGTLSDVPGMARYVPPL